MKKQLMVTAARLANAVAPVPSEGGTGATRAWPLAPSSGAHHQVREAIR